MQTETIVRDSISTDHGFSFLGERFLFTDF